MPPGKSAKSHGTTKEVAAYLRRPEGTLMNWRSLGVGPPYIKVEGRVLYVWADVQKWLDAKAVQPGAEARS